MPTRAPRVRRHDPNLIQSLLSTRDRDGTSLARLAAASGVPIGTLSYWSWRRRQRSVAGTPPFAELVVRAEEAGAVPSAGQPMFELALRNGWRVTIASGFDPEELRRLLAIVEAPAC